MNLISIVAGDQPISEIIPDADLTFKIGIVLGFICGFMISALIVSVYRDYKEDKLQMKGIK